MHEVKTNRLGERNGVVYNYICKFLFFSLSSWIGGEKINKNIEDLNIALSHLNLADIYGILHPTTAEYIFFWSAQGAYSKIYQIQSIEKYNLLKLFFFL